MPLPDWIDKYPQVKALLQREDEDVLYGVEDEPEAPPALTDAEYRQQIREAMADFRTQYDGGMLRGRALLRRLAQSHGREEPHA